MRALISLRLAALSLAVLLTGCGFQLRQELVLPSEMGVVRIETADPNSALARGLEAALRRAGAVSDTTPTGLDASAPVARLRIPVATLTQRPISIGAGGSVQEFALVYQADFELIDSAGVTRLPLQTLSLERIYSFDSAAALGSPGEEEVVREELEREMVAAILRRIEAALRQG